MGWTIGQIRYTETPRGHVAYRAEGSGSVDYLVAQGLLTTLESWPDDDSSELGDGTAAAVRMLARVETRSRCIMFDRSGCGSSDPLPHGLAYTIEDAVDDLLAVLDAVGAERVVANGFNYGAAVAMAFAAAHPERCRALVLENASACLRARPGYDIGFDEAQSQAVIERFCSAWGTGAVMAGYADADSPALVAKAARRERLAATPGTVRAKIEAVLDADVRHHLPSIHCPSLIIHGAHSVLPSIEHGRYLARHIPGARLVEVDSRDVWYLDEDGPAVREWEEFITGLPRERPTQRRLVTVMFSDVVGSTEQAAALGDAAWRRRLDLHDRLSRRSLGRHDGELVKSTGDGILALFPSPSAAIACGGDLIASLAEQGIEVRIGIHTGEVEVRGDDVGGIAVHLASRIQHLAQPGSIVVSAAVPSLVAGSRLCFTDYGRHELKGIDTPQQLYVASAR